MMQTDDTPVLEERTSFFIEDGSLWLPPQSSTTAHEIDGLFYFILYTSTLLTILVTAAMVYFVWKYRRKSHADRPVDVHESKWLELSWVVVPTLLVLVVFFWGFRAYVSTSIPPTDAITINVEGYKWAWNFEYQNGVQYPNEVYVPVGTPIRLEMTSQDVLHSFYVPEFRIKHDVIPNRYSYVWFEAPEEGTYQVLCTEYCGTSHSNMGAKIHVVSRNEYYERRLGPPDQALSLVEWGEQTYTRYSCNSCHSIDGADGVGPSWANVWGAPRPGSPQGEVNEEYVTASILYPQEYMVPGYENGNMPSYDGQLNEAQLAGVSAYIRELSGAATEADRTVLVLSDGQPAEGEAAEGEAAAGEAATPEGEAMTETDE
ncbi:MAG: cytochrome c oxidase subunit II [Bacteroidota bacterium]